MDPLTILERRITYLESILPKETKEQLKEDDVIESVIQANTLISSALSGRVKIKEVVDKSDQLEKLLDPAFLEESKLINTKEIYVNSVVNELATSFELLQKIKALQPTLGAEYFGNIPDVTEKLRTLISIANEQRERNDLTEATLIASIQRYGEIQEEIHRKLKGMNDQLDRYEEELEWLERSRLVN